MIMTSWCGIGPALSRRGGLICCSVMCAKSFTSLRACVNVLFTRQQSAWTRWPRASTAAGEVDVPALAKRHGVDPLILAGWLDYLGISTTGVKIDKPLTAKITKASGFDFVNGWGTGETPNVVANSSDQHVRIPGNLKPHSVAMHPSPSLRVAAGWKSPVTAVMRVNGRVQHAHPECGNGVTWSLELRRGAVRQTLASGVAAGAKEVTFGPLGDVAVRRGDVVSLVIGPRDGNHSCDLTAVDLTLAGGGRVWDLARDVSPNVHAGNPHADAHGNAAVWYFYIEPDQGGSGDRVIPAGSLLARWQSAATAGERQRLAQELEGASEVGSPESEGQSGRKAVPLALVIARAAGERLASGRNRQTIRRRSARSEPPCDRLGGRSFRQAPERNDRLGEPVRASAPGAGGSPPGRPGGGLRVCHRRHSAREPPAAREVRSYG